MGNCKVCTKSENPPIDQFEDILPIEESKRNSNICAKDFIRLKQLGQGAFGKVYLVKLKDSDQVYAMKEITKHHIKSIHQRKNIKNERKILQVMENPFVVKLHYAFQDEKKLFFVVDFVPGGEFFYHIRSLKNKDPYIFTRFYAAEILLAIEYLHSKNIIYRDLKPENILLDSDGHIKLVDFGLSKVLQASQATYSVCGTPEYLAPEILDGKGYDKNCDWWTFGAVIYEMLVGKPPFFIKGEDILFKKKLCEVQIPDFVREDAASLLKGLLQKEPSARLGSQNDAFEIQSHGFFRYIDFEKLKNKEIEPPHKFDNTQFKFFDAWLINKTNLESMKNQSLKVTCGKLSDFTYLPCKSDDLNSPYDQIQN